MMRESSRAGSGAGGCISGAVTAALLYFCINFPMGLAQRLSYARQKGWMHNLCQAAASVASELTPRSV